ncbi:DUF6352 family protein [Pelagibius sp. Alg239-R121]|uniref:DUF6352 family protein n=1 Tax=Pelagibius sp. Alg239-R121 TaxID=2993448 RepID=UPI0024A6FADE|nr:DUF6352 family protein [Pelagibius sp. Alg239-R121]
MEQQDQGSAAGTQPPRQDDFWLTSGYHLLRRGEDSRLYVTNDYLRAFFMRPEMQIVEESCESERALHARLMDDPRHGVSEARLGELQDPDAQDNYRIVLGFRDLLVAEKTLEAAYLKIFRSGVTVPPLFIDQMAHAILRGLLEAQNDAIRARSAELLFRSQKVSIQDSGIMLADEEIVEMYSRDGGFGSLGKLLADNATPMRSVELDILNSENTQIYWARSDSFDTVIDVSFTRPGLDALCRVLEAWVGHFLSVEVTIYPVQQISDPKWSWHIGLDAEANLILNDLYNGEEIDEARNARLLSLFRLEFKQPGDMRADLVGKPVYLGMAMSSGEVLKMKPQNLLMNLPIARAV